MKTATYVGKPIGFRGDARLYELSEPMEDYDGNEVSRVIVSAAIVPYSGPETYIFAADSQGKIADWGELEGSYRGGLDHAEALRGAGYEIAEGGEEQ